MFTVLNWDKVQLEIRPKKHKYHIQEGNFLWWAMVVMEALLLFAGLAVIAFTILYFGG